MCALRHRSAGRELKVIAGSAIQPVTNTLVPRFEQQTGHVVVFVAKKSVAFKQRSERFGAVARGDVQIGFNQVSEIMAVPEVELVGPLPAPIQNHTVMTAAVLSTAEHGAAARDLLRYLSSEEATSAFRRGGFDAP